MRRRSRLPKGSRTAVRILRLLGVGGTGTLLLVCLIVSFCAIGSKYTSTAAGATACELPEVTGGAGVEVFGDSTLTGVAAKLPTTMAGGKVSADVAAGRTAQQGENLLNALPDSAPSVFVLSLAEDDPSSASSYTDRIDELMLLMSGRTVYWVTAPGRDTDNSIVNKENTADPGDPEDASGWHIVDFAASVTQHPDWWDNNKPSSTGLTNLAQTLTAQIQAATTATTGTSTTGTSASGITVTSTANSNDSFPLQGEQLANAQTIVSTGTSMGVPQQGEIIALATAIQESKLLDSAYNSGHYGVFQQDPRYWGTIAQIKDVAHATTSFYQHLLAVPDWQNLSVAQAAEVVQQSGMPQYYAQWQQAATTIVAALLGQHATGCGPQVNVPGNPKAQIAVNAALSQLGVAYSFAGGNLQGPTLGVCEPGTDGWNDCHIVGFDCSGLMLYAWGKAGVTVPHFTGAMWTDPDFTHITSIADLQPGDMMMFEGPPPGHTGMYIGNGKLVDAPHSGTVVKIESVNDPWYAQNFVGALRPKV